MKNKLWKIMIVNSILISAITLSGKTTVSVQAEETELSAESETDQQILCDDAVEDALIIDKDEILPVVSLEEGQPYAVYDQDGRILLYTFHKYPDSYPDGADVKLEWGNVWTFTGGELEEWYQKNKKNSLVCARIMNLIILRLCGQNRKTFSVRHMSQISEQ